MEDQIRKEKGNPGREESAAASPAPLDFIRSIVREDLKANKSAGKVVTRFPPEPNGYLHIGHAKSICLNFGVAAEFGGTCNLRFDDTNPTKEEVEYVEAIQADVRWLGFDWDNRLYSPYGISATASAWQRETTWSMSRSWNILCART
jgi:glutaminyl-tRNA synthetase